MYQNVVKDIQRLKVFLLTSKHELVCVLPFTGRMSLHRRCSIKKVVRKNFAKFIGKHLCQSLSFNKIASLRPATLFKKRL